jgi:hypothetical protein
MAEPFNLREWRRRSRQTSEEGRLFTYGRPGRGTSGYGKTRKRVDVPIIDQWVEGLPHAEILHIVSLLGRKKNDGYSEFAYYPFRYAMETGSNPTFQEWLDSRYDRRFVVHEFPTVDAQGISRDVLDAVTTCISTLTRNSNAVVLIDSAGAERTARVCEALEGSSEAIRFRFSTWPTTAPITSTILEISKLQVTSTQSFTLSRAPAILGLTKTQGWHFG